MIRSASEIRQRGFFLTQSGLHKLQMAMQRWELKSGNKASPRQLAVVVQLAGLPGPHHNTIRRILAQQVCVDITSLQLLFRAFSLRLEQGDYTRTGWSLSGESGRARRHSPLELRAITASRFQLQALSSARSQVVSKVKLFIAASLDGYIARPSGEVDWLFTDQDYGYSNFFAGIDAVVMGRHTYEQIQQFGEYPYKGKRGFVFSKTRKGERNADVEFIAEEPARFIKDLRQTLQGDIWLDGGAALIQAFLQEDLIDEFVISIHPVILGDGIPLFRSPLATKHLKFRDCQTFDTGLVQLTYERQQNL